MKKTKRCTTLILLTCSLHAFAIGLGDMTVLSSLDQSFDAEIALIDVGDIPLSEIKATLSDVESYARAGLERSFGLNTLTFVVEHNRQGQPVIHVRSIERITDPFIQLLIDLAWAKGQIYREYDVLLDPPDYQFAVKKETQTHRINQTKQHVLPEKSMNDEEEADSRKPESVVLSEVTYESRIPFAPVLARPGPLSKQYLSASQDSAISTQPGASHLEGINTVLKAQMDVTAQAIDSLRESNALLKEQLHSMHAQNQTLQTQLKKRDAEIKHMHAQIELLMRRQGVAGQVIQPSEHTQQSDWFWVLIVLGVVAGGAYVAWRKWGVPHVRQAYDPRFSRIEEEPLKPVRSQSALDTLLTIAQTYIDKGDTAAANESLKEVLEFGNKKQQAAAKKLMKLL